MNVKILLHASMLTLLVSHVASLECQPDICCQLALHSMHVLYQLIVCSKIQPFVITQKLHHQTHACSLASDPARSVSFQVF